TRGWRQQTKITSVRLLHCTNDSHNTQYVNKLLIYIIKKSDLLCLHRVYRSRGYSIGDLISGAKLIHCLEQAAFRLARGDAYRLGSRICDEDSVLQALAMLQRQ